LVARADRALYQAKGAGRDRIVAAAGPAQAQATSTAMTQDTT
jgi:hypothetical protein